MSNYSVSEDALMTQGGRKKKETTQEIVTLVKVNFAHFLNRSLEKKKKKKIIIKNLMTTVMETSR